MIVHIESHLTKTLAERARYAYVQAQIAVDRVWQTITGETVEPSAADTYDVLYIRNQWVVTYFDPSIESTTDVSSSDERAYDCGD